MRSRIWLAVRRVSVFLLASVVVLSPALADGIPESFLTSAGTVKVEVAVKGLNYPWSLSGPLANWDVHYWREDIPDPPTRPDLAAPIYFWNPSLAPSGMIYYTGDEFAQWKGSLMVGGLVSKSITRLALQGEHVISDERMDFGVRIRDVAQGPDGAIYLLTDEHDPDGRILRLTLEKPAAETKSASTMTTKQ